MLLRGRLPAQPLFELLARLRVHPVQYLLVGLALCVFYLLLLSLSEQVGFSRAYAIAATMVIGLVIAGSCWDDCLAFFGRWAAKENSKSGRRGRCPLLVARR